MKEPVKPPEANWIELGKDEHEHTQWAKVTQHLPNSVVIAYADGSNVVQDYMIYDGKHWSIQDVSSLGRNIGGSKTHLYKLLRQGPRLDYASTEPHLCICSKKELFGGVHVRGVLTQCMVGVFDPVVCSNNVIFIGFFHNRKFPTIHWSQFREGSASPS